MSAEKSKRRGVVAKSEAAGPRVAILLPCLIFGGAERAVLTLARALTQLGCRVSILLLSHEGQLLEEAQREWRVVDLQCQRTKYLPQRLVAYLSANPTDVLLSNFWKLNLCACIVRTRFPRLRLLLWEHGHPSASRNSPNILFAASASILYRMATKVICVSSGVAHDVLNLTLGLKSRVIVINNPVPPTEPTPRRSRSGVKRIAWVGRLHEEKNPRLLIDAFVLVASEVDAELLFIGDGVMRAELEAMSAQSGVGERIIFAGFLNKPNELLVDCDLLVSTSNWEGFGNVLVEAMYSGLSVVSTDSGGGVDDIIGESMYGSIVPRGDARALAQSIVTELACPRDPEQQKRGARRFLPRTIAAQFIAAAGIYRP